MAVRTFTTVGWHYFTVPAKVTSVSVTIDGAGSGPRAGGRVTGKLAVAAGQRVYCHVGQAGKLNSGSTPGGSSYGAGAAGGTGRGSQAGGDGGGGYSCIRIGSTTGTLKAVAGGAGGDSGDGGKGGLGGGLTGGPGSRGTAGVNATGAATGGTQAQGGNGGTSSYGTQFNGKNAADTAVAVAGAGGSGGTTTNSHGGGGGGGGYHPGGGGQASANGYAPGGGGGGGSSYIGGLSGSENTQGGGGTGTGLVTVTWVDPPPANIPPSPISGVKVGGVEESSGMLTKATTSIRVSGYISDPNKSKVRLLARWSTSQTFSPYKQVLSGWVVWKASPGAAVAVTLTGLSQDTHYYVRLYTQDARGAYSTNYNSIDFWTNKKSLPPTDLTINTQGSGMNLPSLSSATLAWTHNDPDIADYQTAFQLQYRKSATAASVAGAWTSTTQYVGANGSKVPGPPSSSRNDWVFNPATFKGNTFYEWQVRTRDSRALWGDWSALFFFHATSTSTPPVLLSPPDRSPILVHDPTTLSWRFIDPDTGDVQVKADIRYRAMGDTKTVTSGQSIPIAVGASMKPYKVFAMGAQDFALDEDADVWYQSYNSVPAQAFPIEDNRVQRLNANGTVRDFMTVKEIGHGMPLDVETISGQIWVTLAYYHRTSPSYFEKFVKLPYVPGKTYTLAQALTYQIPNWPHTEYPWNPPQPPGMALQGWTTKDDYVYRMYDDKNAYASNPDMAQFGVTRIDIIYGDKILQTMLLPKAGYNDDGTVTNGRRESEGLRIHVVGGVPYLDFGVVTGSAYQKTARHRIYRLAMEGPLPVPPDWTNLIGEPAPGIPGSTQSWTLPADTFSPDYTYEWQVRTYDLVGGPPSAWSDSFRMYAINAPGAEAGPLPIGGATKPQGALGCGAYRVFIYQQGGQRRLGEIEPIDHLTFTRVRDDISSCTTFSAGYSEDCGSLYASVRTWMHELVVFRDGVRVWEGPITRIGYSANTVEFEAKDVMAYLYRRLLRAGYNDAYRLVKKGAQGTPDEYLGLLSVVKRASMLITQALAPYDPNVLPYLTSIEFADDARESRVVAAWSRTAWEEVDDLAATAGLDYTTVGRRILLWDTHRPIGRLPEMRDGDFSDAPVVTEYGMQLATYFAVTNGSGVVGSVEVAAKTTPYGPIEQLASSYSDSAAAATEVLTPAALAAAEKSMTEQAQRNLSGRWPAPLVVRVPDNATLSPAANVGFQQLIPGVWLPLRSVRTPRQVLQWQKLDSVGVDVDEKGEQVHVVLSPAPNGGNDPDSDAAAEAAAND